MTKNLIFHITKILVIASFCCKSVESQYEKQYCEAVKEQLYITRGLIAAFDYESPPIEIKNDKCSQIGGFILGGEEARSKEFPHAALLGIHDRQTGKIQKWFCGGTLISDKYVLTAAHCLNTPSGRVSRVRLGELDFSTDRDDAQPEDFSVKNAIPYTNNNYNDDDDDGNLYHDIALIELDRKVIFNLYKYPACLPLSYDEGTTSKYIAIGWGNTDAAKPPSSHLMKVNLDPYDNNRCNRFISNSRSRMFPNGLDTSTQLCAGSTERKDTCSGDSGGPLLVYHPQQSCMYTIVGITSAGVALCGVQNAPGIYTRVHPYVNWIRRIVWPGK